MSSGSTTSQSSNTDPGAVFVAGMDATSSTFRDPTLLSPDFEQIQLQMQTPPPSRPFDSGNLVEAKLVEDRSSNFHNNSQQLFVGAQSVGALELKDVVQNK